MYLASVTISGFRKLGQLEVKFREGLNVLVGPNNAGKTAVVDALRVLLSAGDDGALRVHTSDLHFDADGANATEATFHYVFRGLSQDEEADFLTALRPIDDGDGVPKFEAHLFVRYSNADITGKLRVKRWCGAHEENTVTPEMLEDLRTVYLPPLRDPNQGLKPNRNSQIARLVHRLSNEESRKQVADTLAKLDLELKAKKPISDTEEAITKRHSDMLGSVLLQSIQVSLSPSDFQRVAARLSLLVETFDIDQNGLGYNNLIYMAVVLADLSLSTDSTYCALIVEEPEAHLHPQLQAVLLQYLSSVEKPKEGEKPVQVFVTSHSPSFASLAEVDSLACIYQSGAKPAAFFPREIAWGPGKKEKLQRYLNVTRAELFFARRVIFVEGAAELFIVEVLAERLGINLRQHSVSIISTDGLNFDAFLPMFGDDALKVRVAVLTDADPPKAFPKAGDKLELSAAAQAIKKYANGTVSVFFAQKTLEYDIALKAANHPYMLAALQEMHPEIGKALAETVENTPEDEKARALFQGIFERGEGRTKVQKGTFAQTLADHLSKGGIKVAVPPYIQDALTFITAG